MSLKSKVSDALDLLSSAPGESEPKTINIEAAGLRLTCEALEVGALGCAFGRFELASDRLAGAETPRLREISEQLSAKLTYLLEAISPIEIDEAGCVVQLRSNPPHKDENGTSYYELLVRGSGELRICRYAKQHPSDQSPGGQRAITPASVTREVFLRLVERTGRPFNDRRHFFNVAAMAMRQLLTDHARRHAGVHAAAHAPETGWPL